MPNMEQDFRTWLLTQLTKKGNPFNNRHTNNFARAFEKVIKWIPKKDSLDEDIQKIGRRDSIFDEPNVDAVEKLYKQCLQGGDLYEENKKFNNMLASNALGYYIKFLESRNNQKYSSDTVETKEDEPITAELKEDKTMKHPLNQILYGPPGTGKTYSTVKKALEILEATDEQKQEIKSIKKLKKVFSSQIEFVTFHQNFSYEDFVEGIKAKIKNDKITYETESGIFKLICEAATDSELIIYLSESQDEADDDENNDSIKQFYEVIDKLKKQLLKEEVKLTTDTQNSPFTLWYDEDKNQIIYATPDGAKHGVCLYVKNVLKKLYKNPDIHTKYIHGKRGYAVPVIEYLENECGLQKYQATEKPKEQQSKAGENDSLKQLHEAIDMLKEQLLEEDLQLKTLAQGKPFTLSYKEGRETFHAVPNTEAQSLCTIPVENIEKLYKNPEILADYSNKEGIRFKVYTSPIIDYLKTKFGVPDYQENNSNTQPHQEIEESETLENEFDSQEPHIAKEPHVLIIDEINRGNISRILGELITLIEPSKRAGADEEIEVTLPYSKESFSVPDNLYIIGTMNTADRSLAQLDIALRRRFRFVEMMPEYDPELFSDDIAGVNLSEMLKAMNTRICKLLDREHQIGHSFFMKVASLDDLKETFQHEILPLLEEYFFENWEKILEVLNNKEIFYKKIDGNENSNTPYRKLTVDEWGELNAKDFNEINDGE